ncbi:MAG: DUF58 domain-containing protein [Gammaproteobacteria bacterium]|nr:DUF58 domain-containing protein [Gammaproteobacteria bacterium]
MQAAASSADSSLPTSIALGLRRVYIVPTRYGYLLGGLLLIILLGAINYDNALAYLLCFLLGGLSLVAMLHTYRNLAGLKLASAAATPVFVGDQAPFRLHLESAVGRPRSNVSVLWVATPPRGVVRATATTLNLSTTDAQATLRIPTARRGRLPLKRVRVESVFPLGILRAWAYFETSASAVVYPAPRGRLTLPVSPADVAASALGSAPGTDDFAGLRPYRPGDRLAAIHWPALAKSATLLVKRFQGGGEGEVWLRWQDLGLVPEREARLSQLTRWVLDAEQRGLRYGLELPNASLPVARGAAHAAAALRLLALYDEP